MNWTLWEFALLALVMWREGRGEGTEGMRATGHVAWNRHEQSGKSLGEIITQDAQFTSINPFKKTYDSQLDEWPAPGNEMFRSALRIAAEIMNGSSVDPTNGATFYRNPQTATSEWFQKAVESGKLQFAVTLGAHDFYTERKA